MNIFYLDQDPKLCAQYHCDKHVVKMILESAQLLCTAVNVAAGEQVTPYKSTHVNHPCSIWVRESYNNWSYVFRLALELETEWQYRFKHTRNHLSIAKLIGHSPSIINQAVNCLSSMPFTATPLCMPEYCKVYPMNHPTWDAVASYRNYYNQEKKHLYKWTNREVPFWAK